MESGFKREFELPAWSNKAMLNAVLLCFLPNLFFLAVAWGTGAARPIINADYLYVALFYAILPKRFKILGVIGLLIATLFDCLMLLMQFFPFMDLDGALYLAPFFLLAPKLYKIIIAIIAVYTVIISPVILQKISYKTNFYHVAILVAIFATVGYFTGHLYYKPDGGMAMFGKKDFYYIKSQMALYDESRSWGMIEERDKTTQFSELKYDQASKNLASSQSPKILLIVAESWGSAKKAEANNDILKNILALKDNYLIDWQMGAFPFVGATVEGEMRELCHTHINGFALRLTPEKDFASCLPNQFKQRGYYTVSLHGASSQLYDRFSWYKKAGLQENIFAENLMDKKKCSSFNGVCDTALFPVVQKYFAQYPKLFFYWMTLTSHSTYPAEDIESPNRFDCTKYAIDEKAELCNNFKMHAQFFDHLALLLQKPEMKGTQVIVVGDHPPPTMILLEPMKYTDEGKVAWMSFKVKD